MKPCVLAIDLHDGKLTAVTVLHERIPDDYWEIARMEDLASGLNAAYNDALGGDDSHLIVGVYDDEPLMEGTSYGHFIYPRGGVWDRASDRFTPMIMAAYAQHMAVK